MDGKVIILHDVDGRIYFQAIKQLSDEGKIDTVVFREVHFLKRLASSVYKRSFSMETLYQFFNNLFFFLSIPFVSGKTIIIGMAPYNIRFIWYGVLARRNKVIYHTSWPYWWGRNVPHKNGFLFRFSECLYIKYFDLFKYKFVCVTEPVLDSLIQKNINIDNCHIIPHAVDLEIFKAKSEQELYSADARKKIIFVGRIVKEKGVYQILELARKLQNECDFDIVGGGPDYLNIQNEAHDLDNLTFHGYKEKIEVSNLLAMNQILILPSIKNDKWEELFGLVIIEAMSVGLVVISTDHVGPRGIIKNNKNGFLIHDDDIVNQSLEIINSLDFNSEVTREIINSARESVEDYNIGSIKKKWAEIINEKTK